MGYLAAYHFEHGEDHGAFANYDASPPVTDEVSDTNPIGGSYSKHYVFGSSDDVLLANASIYNRATVATPICIGLALKIDDLSLFNQIYPMSLQVDSSFSVSYMVLTVTTTGRIRVYRSTSYTAISGDTLLGASADGVFKAGVRNYLSVRLVVGDPTGELQVDCNGARVIDETGINTNPSSGTPTVTWGWYAFYSNESGVAGEVWIDDFVLADDMADPIPPIIHEALVPDGVTADDDGTPTGAATNWEACDETPQDGGTTYTTLPVGKQGFTFTNRTETGDPVYVLQMASIGDPASGSEVVNGFVSDGTETDGDQIGITAAFDAQQVSDLLTTPPSGGSWDTTKIDGLTAGFERAS